MLITNKKFTIILLIFFSLFQPVIAQKINDPLLEYSHVFMATKMKGGGLYVCRIKNDGVLNITDEEIVKYIKSIIYNREGKENAKNWVLLVKTDLTEQAPKSNLRLDLLPIKTMSGFQWMKGLQSISRIDLTPDGEK